MHMQATAAMSLAPCGWRRQRCLPRRGLCYLWPVCAVEEELKPLNLTVA